MEQTISEGARFSAMRQAMVTSQLRTTAVSDRRVVEAMASVARENYVPSERKPLAYADGLVPLGRGRALNPPMATGKLLTEAYLRASDRVLLIGAATGYTAAVLARIVAALVAVEVDPLLAEVARATLARQPAVTIVEGPLEAGNPSGAPYDAIVIDGAIETLPSALVAQIAVGGHLVTGRHDRGVHRLAAGVRSANGFGLADFADVACAELPGFARPRAFRF